MCEIPVGGGLVRRAFARIRTKLHHQCKHRCLCHWGHFQQLYATATVGLWSCVNVPFLGSVGAFGFPTRLFTGLLAPSSWELLGYQTLFKVELTPWAKGSIQYTVRERLETYSAIACANLVPQRGCFYRTEITCPTTDFHLPMRSHFLQTTQETVICNYSAKMCCETVYKSFGFTYSKVRFLARGWKIIIR